MPATITPPPSPNANADYNRILEPKSSLNRTPSATKLVAPGAAAPSFEPPTATKVATSVVNYQTRWEREKAKARAEGADIESGDPKMIGPWVIGEMLGRGASGRVRLARHFSTGKMAAVKILNLHPSLSSRSSTLKSAGEKAEKMRLTAEREIAVMKLLDHPNIMKMYDVWSSPKELYLVLEYVQGGELFDYLCSRGSRLPLLEAIGIIKQVLAGVDYCHRFHICHRDLKPENILLTSGDKGKSPHKRVKIADFGMSALDSLNGLLRTSCGSPHYASPEIVRGHTYSGAVSDIWSCGVILYALLTSRLPFDDPNVNNVLRKVRDGRFTIPEWVAPSAQDLLIRMLEVDLTKRITMRQIFQHPLLQLDTPGIILPPVPKIEDYALPVARDDVDADLLRSLCIIWREKDLQSMIARLCSDTPNFEKAFYFLLCRYRDRSFEEYNMEYPSSSHSSSLASTPVVTRPGTPIRDPRDPMEETSPIRRHYPGKVAILSPHPTPKTKSDSSVNGSAKRSEPRPKHQQSPSRPRILSDTNAMAGAKTRTRAKTLREEQATGARARSGSGSSTRSRAGSSPSQSNASTQTKRPTPRRSSTSAPRARSHASPPGPTKERTAMHKPSIDVPRRLNSPARVNSSLVRQLASLSTPAPARLAPRVASNAVPRPLTSVAEERQSRMGTARESKSSSIKRALNSKDDQDITFSKANVNDKPLSTHHVNHVPRSRDVMKERLDSLSFQQPTIPRPTATGLGVFLAENAEPIQTAGLSSVHVKDGSRIPEDRAGASSSGETWEEVEWPTQSADQGAVKKLKPRRRPPPLDLLNPYHRDRRTPAPQASPSNTPIIGSPLLHPFMNFSALSWATASPVLASPTPERAVPLQRNSSSQSTPPATIGSRGILARFFDWKSPDLSILSSAGLSETRSEVTRLLSLCNATFLQTESGSYKCRIDEFVDAQGNQILKSVRFRITISPLSQGPSTSVIPGGFLPERQSERLLQASPVSKSGASIGCIVTFAQERGAYSVLKMVHQDMVKRWSLDASLGSTLVSTAQLPPTPISAGLDSSIPMLPYARSST
ncbi:related to serine/threonine protein kinase [Serendipita indica DSM 11827]|uniref:Related to serine/threonine protein kinase n=1 Tax=Serendipita indica (strain DSM 11827) TaxID=1109443 RepID=G4TPB4_SERID|nr:related to serine/threonine protein kinase [Serendipita indica DSM 11827]